MAPLLPVAVSFILGILMQGAAGQLWWAVVFLASAIVLLCFKRSYPALLALCAAAGFFVSWAHVPQPLPEGGYTRSHKWSGTVAGHREYEGAQMLIVRVDSCDSEACPSFQVKCLVPSLLPMIDESDRVGFAAGLQPLTDETDLPDEEDYNLLLSRMGVMATAIISPDSIISVVAEPGVMHDIRRLRRDVQRLIAVAPLADNTRSFLIAALTGDRAWLSADTRELFSATGIAHILALSGLHVGVLTLVFILLLFPFSSFAGGRYGRMIVTVGALWVFAVLTGLSPSVVRAVIMATLFAVCTMMQRVWSPLNALSAAVILILLFSPVQIYTLGFQLTFLAVLAIIVFAGRLNPFDYRHRHLRNLSGYLCVTLAAMLGTGMVCAYEFHIFPVYFLITNIAVSLLLPPLLGGGVVLLLFNAVGIRAAWLGHVVDWLMMTVQRIASAISSLPGATVGDLWIPWWMPVLYFVALALFGFWLYRRRVVMLYAMGAVVVFGFMLTVILPEQHPVREAYITRSASETTMIVRDGDNLYAYSTAPVGRLDEVRQQAAHRYRNYMLRRGLTEITPLHDGLRAPHTAREGNVVVACGKSFAFVSHDSHVCGYVGNPDYAVVCRGFRGDICEAARIIGADTILLSRDLNLRRHDRYVRELTLAAIPHRTLRDAPFKLVE